MAPSVGLIPGQAFGNESPLGQRKRLTGGSDRPALAERFGSQRPVAGLIPQALKGGIANQSPPEPELRYPRVSGQRRRPIAGSSLALRKCAQQVGVVRSESQQRFEGTFSLGGVMSCQCALAGVVGALEILERSSAARQADGNQSRRHDTLGCSSTRVSPAPAHNVEAADGD